MPEGEIGFMSIAALGRAFRDGGITPFEAVEDCLNRIARHDGVLNAFATVTADTAREAARRAAAELSQGIDRGPLHGVPVALKDLIDVAGVPTGYGSSPVFCTVPGRNARIAERLEAAGAVLVGKTNLLEFAYGAVNPVVGQTNNPWDSDRTSGGSSGGSAAAVAAGMAFAAVGTDTGGSIRIPASYCGIVGLKPTFGLVPLEGVFPLSWTLDHAGPMARTCADALAFLDALTAETGPTEALPLQGRRFGILRDHSGAPCIRPDVSAAFEAALAGMARAGATFQDVWLPELEGMAEALLDILLPEAAIIHESRLAAHADAYADVTRAQIEAGPGVSGIAYLKGHAHRKRLTAAMEAALDGIDALIGPTAPWVSPAEDPAVVGDEGYDEMLCTGPTNLTGLPALSLFGGTGADGLPVGIMLTGARGADRRLLRIGSGIETVIAPQIAPTMTGGGA
ncbi:MAG: amidase [Rubellimicrobium sp.]|nr:amidase [Rubellimicrobium sp.]